MTPHLTPDQLSGLADGNRSTPGSKALFEHLAVCPDCRDSLFLLSSPVRQAARDDYHWLIAAAVLLAVLVPFLSITRWRADLNNATLTAKTDGERIPPAFRRVSLTSSRPQAAPRLYRTIFAPQHDQFVVQTASGERWISFETIKLFRESTFRE